VVLQRGYDSFQEGDYERALLHYLQAAEMGYELGQSNAAWLLTHVRALSELAVYLARGVVFTPAASTRKSWSSLRAPEIEVVLMGSGATGRGWQRGLCQ